MEVTKENFWDLDLEEIESSFLPEGVKVTDLPILEIKIVSEEASKIMRL